jgi:hypothetical protein
MRTALKLVFSAMLAAYPFLALQAQDLAPRAYLITPVHSNAVTLTYSFSNRGVFFNNALPVRDATGIIHVPLFIYSHSLNFFGRTATFTAALPYGVGHFQGTVMDNEVKPYRSGLLDSSFRFSVNLMGGPSMSAKEFQSWQQKTIVPPGNLEISDETGVIFPS